MGDGFLDAVVALPPGSGLVFRHYSLPDRERKALFYAAHRIVQANGDGLVYLADSIIKSIRWQADGVHLRGASPRAISEARRAQRLGLGVTQSVHNLAEMRRANLGGATAIVSPVYPTRSHPHGAVLGEEGFAALTRYARVPVIALGGMTATRFAQIAERGAYGWAAIDAFIPSPTRLRWPGDRPHHVK